MKREKLDEGLAWLSLATYQPGGSETNQAGGGQNSPESTKNEPAEDQTAGIDAPFEWDDDDA